MAIRPTRAWADSTGQLHTTREDACKAEYRRLLLNEFPDMPLGTVEQLVEGMFVLDRIYGEATKEDSRMQLVDAA